MSWKRQQCRHIRVDCRSGARREGLGDDLYGLSVQLVDLDLPAVQPEQLNCAHWTAPRDLDRNGTGVTCYPGLDNATGRWNRFYLWRAMNRQPLRESALQLRIKCSVIHRGHRTCHVAHLNVSYANNKKNELLCLVLDQPSTRTIRDDPIAVKRIDAGTEVGCHMQHCADGDVGLAKGLSNLHGDCSTGECRVDVYAFYGHRHRQGHRVLQDFQHQVDVRNLGVRVFAGELQVGKVRATLEQRP